MTIVSGELSEIGSGVSSVAATKYTYLKVGTERLRDVIVDNYMADFLVLGENVRMSIWRFRRINVLVALKRPDGEVFKHTKFGGVLIGDHVGVTIMCLIGAGILTTFITAPFFFSLLGSLGIVVSTTLAFVATFAGLLWIGPLRTHRNYKAAMNALDR